MQQLICFDLQQPSAKRKESTIKRPHFNSSVHEEYIPSQLLTHAHYYY
jgi:hypothetical protein